MQLKEPYEIVSVNKEDETEFYKNNPDFMRVPEHLQKTAQKLQKQGLTGGSNRQLKKWAREQKRINDRKQKGF